MTPEAQKKPISFQRWQQALATSGESLSRQRIFREEIMGFLRQCKQRHSPASVELAKQYLAAWPTQDGNEARDALRWFVRAAAEEGKAERLKAERLKTDSPLAHARGYEATTRGQRLATPPLAATDTGASAWEQALIQEMRSRNFLWRTEETYRRWAGRFAQFIAPRSPDAVGTAEVGRFLDALALQQRASASTQKQALNALVFFLQEALHRDLGKLHYERARKPVRLPSVLSREECRRLFAQLNGTTLLMAELAYGSGLRLMELLRLRVHHVDLARGQLRILGGKGDRVKSFAPRGSMLELAAVVA
jgi:hypothetical protein